MTNAMALRPTDAQKSYITSLLAQRDVPQWLRDEAAAPKDKKDASRVIDLLLKRPRVARPVRPAAAATVREYTPEQKAYFDALANAEVSKYAVPTLALNIAIPELKTSGDLLFLEVRNWAGKRRFSRLVGAPGGFSRYRIPMAQATGLLQYIAGRHVEFARLFSEHYSVCGRCAAELTDEESRRLGFGPHCAKIFGLV